MHLTFEKWSYSCILGICLVHLCLAALPSNGAHDLDNLTAQDQTSSSKPSPLHTNRVFNRAIRPQVNVPAQRLNSQHKSQPTQPKVTSTTSAAAEVEEEAEEDTAESQSNGEEESARPQEEPVTPTINSTEATRKPIGGVIRPFRSNKDLLDSLKRRRQMQQQHGYTVVPPTSASTTSEKPLNKSSQSTRKIGNSSTKSSGLSADHVGVGSHKKTTASRRYSTKSIQVTSTTPLSSEAITEESNLESQPPYRSSRNYPKTRRIS